MNLSNKLFFQFKNDRCEFRSITPDDVTSEYVNGLIDQHEYLLNRQTTIESQKEYIKNINESDNDAIFGLFVNSELIGTSGVQGLRIDSSGIVSIGIFIFKPEMRGKGYGKILVWASCYLTNKPQYYERKFFAGVKKDNVASWKAFMACGFISDPNCIFGARPKDGDYFLTTSKPRLPAEFKDLVKVE